MVGAWKKSPMEAAARGLAEQTVAACYRVPGLEPREVGTPGFPDHPLGSWYQAPEEELRTVESPERKRVRIMGRRLDIRIGTIISWAFVTPAGDRA